MSVGRFLVETSPSLMTAHRLARCCQIDPTALATAIAIYLPIASEAVAAATHMTHIDHAFRADKK